MEGGQLYKKIAFIIQARLGSERFPKKVLLPLPLKGGKPVIQWITDQLKMSDLDSEIILATSENSSNDDLYKFSLEQNVQCFRGSENDVLSRFSAICKQYNPEVVVRLTGDNPLLDIDVIEHTVQRHIKQNNDYTATTGLPIGMNIEVISSKIFSQRNKNQTLSAVEKEHVTLHIKNSSYYKKEYIDFSDQGKFEKLRLTLDYPSDFALFSNILPFYEKPGKTGLNLVQFILDQYPWVFQINADKFQKKQYKNISDEICAAVEVLQKFDMSNAAKLIEPHKG